VRTLGANYTTLHVYSYVGSITEMLDNPHHKDELYRWGLRPGTMFACGVDFLLRLRPEALAPFQDELRVRRQSCTLQSVSIPARRTTHTRTTACLFDCMPAADEQLRH